MIALARAWVTLPRAPLKFVRRKLFVRRRGTGSDGRATLVLTLVLALALVLVLMLALVSVELTLVELTLVVVSRVALVLEAISLSPTGRSATRQNAGHFPVANRRGCTMAAAAGRPTRRWMFFHDVQFGREAERRRCAIDVVHESTGTFGVRLFDGAHLWDTTMTFTESINGFNTTIEHFDVMLTRTWTRLAAGSASLVMGLTVSSSAPGDDVVLDLVVENAWGDDSSSAAAEPMRILCLKQKMGPIEFAIAEPLLKECPERQTHTMSLLESLVSDRAVLEARVRRKQETIDGLTQQLEELTDVLCTVLELKQREDDAVLGKVVGLLATKKTELQRLHDCSGEPLRHKRDRPSAAAGGGGGGGGARPRVRPSGPSGPSGPPRSAGAAILDGLDASLLHRVPHEIPSDLPRHDSLPDEPIAELPASPDDFSDMA